MANLSNINNFFVVEQTTGYVGIGNTDPAFPLEVKSASAELALNATGGSIYRLKSDSTDYFRINKNGVGDRLVIAGGGDVGIGISAPTTKLHLGGTAPLDSIIRQDSTVSGTNWEIGERAAGKWQIWQDDGDTVVATFMSTGNVGIGTESPTYKLDVVGNGRFSGFLEMVTGGAVYQGQKFYLDGGGDTFLESPSSNIMTFTTNAVEKMRIVSTGAVGIDNSSPDSFSGGGSTAASLVIGKGTSGVSPHITLWQGNSAQASLSFASANTGTGQYEGRIRYTRDTGVMDFRTNGIANVLVLNASGNVGIGTTSPSNKLEVAGNINVIAPNPYIWIGESGSGGGAGFIGWNDASDYLFLGHSYGSAFNKDIVINSSGNIGIGTTSPDTKLHVSSAALSNIRMENTNTAIVSGENYGEIQWEGNDINSDANGVRASIVVQGYGAGTQGETAMYFRTSYIGNDKNQNRMTITHLGDVGIGTTSPDGSDWNASSKLLHIYQNDTNGGLLKLESSNTTGILAAGNNQFQIGTIEAQPLKFYTGGSERMRISNLGVVSVGTASPITDPFISSNQFQQLQVGKSGVIGSYTTTSGECMISNNIYVGSTYNTFQALDTSANGTAMFLYNTYIAFKLGTTAANGTVGAAEWMRIDPSGNSLFGTTSSSAGSGTGVKILTATNGERVSVVSANFASGAEGLTMYSTSAGAWRFYVSWDGVIHASSTSISAISDITLKENIKPLETGLNEVMKLKPRRFDWKNGDGKNIAGFIAQEVEEVLPDLVSDYKYTDEETKKALKMGDMIPTLVKSIQELKVEIETLKTQINN